MGEGFTCELIPKSTTEIINKIQTQLIEFTSCFPNL